MLCRQYIAQLVLLKITFTAIVFLNAVRLPHAASYLWQQPAGVCRLLCWINRFMFSPPPFFFFFPLGCKCLHSKLFSLHFVGFTVCFPGCLPCQGICSLCLRLWNSRGKVSPLLFSFWVDLYYDVGLFYLAVLDSHWRFKKTQRGGGGCWARVSWLKMKQLH